jgi:hypothetical protein
MRTPTSAYDPAAGKDVYEPEKIIGLRLSKGTTGCWWRSWRQQWPDACAAQAWGARVCTPAWSAWAAHQEAQGEPVLTGGWRQDQEGGGRHTLPTAFDELEAYLAEADEEDFDIKLLTWWHAKETKWPNLAKMVKQYLSAPASSAGVERVFSAAGNMHGDLQKSAKDTTLEHSLFAAFNTDWAAWQRGGIWGHVWEQLSNEVCTAVGMLLSGLGYC